MDMRDGLVILLIDLHALLIFPGGRCGTRKPSPESGCSVGRIVEKVRINLQPTASSCCWFFRGSSFALRGDANRSQRCVNFKLLSLNVQREKVKKKKSVPYLSSLFMFQRPCRMSNLSKVPPRALVLFSIMHTLTDALFKN